MGFAAVSVVAEAFLQAALWRFLPLHNRSAGRLKWPGSHLSRVAQDKAKTNIALRNSLIATLLELGFPARFLEKLRDAFGRSNELGVTSAFDPKIR